MSEITRAEVLAKKRDPYSRAGKEPKNKIITELVELFGYHPKSAIRAMRPRPGVVAPFVRSRPKEYDPEKLLPPLEAIWYDRDNWRRAWVFTEDGRVSNLVPAEYGTKPALSDSLLMATESIAKRVKLSRTSYQG